SRQAHSVPKDAGISQRGPIGPHLAWTGGVPPPSPGHPRSSKFVSTTVFGYGGIIPDGDYEIAAAPPGPGRSRQSRRRGRGVGGEFEGQLGPYTPPGADEMADVPQDGPDLSQAQAAEGGSLLPDGVHADGTLCYHGIDESSPEKIDGGRWRTCTDGQSLLVEA